MFFIFNQKTAYDMRISDWSSDVCSSDLINGRDALAVLFRVPIHRRMHRLVKSLARLADAFGIGRGRPVAVRRDHQLARGTDWKSVGQGTSVSVRVAFGGRRNVKKKTTS